MSKQLKHRDFHKLAIIKREARGHTFAIPSKKLYNRKKLKAHNLYQN